MIISFIICISSFILIVLFAAFSGTCVPETRDAVYLFLSSVLPVMLPFYVLSSLVVSCGILPKICSPMRGVTKRLFRLPAECCGAIILGFLCGFPMGAKITGDILQKGYISEKEAACLCAFTNNVSPVFMASVIGSGCLGSTSAGIIIWFITVISSVLSGIIVCHSALKGSEPSMSAASPDTVFPAKFKIDLPSAIMSAMNTVLYVGAVIIFFSSVTSLIKLIPCFDGATGGFMHSFLEITGGLTRLIPNITKAQLSRPLCQPYITYAAVAAISSWAGLSVHIQVSGIMTAGGIKLKYYFICKILQTIIAPLTGAAFCAVGILR